MVATATVPLQQLSVAVRKVPKALLSEVWEFQAYKYTNSWLGTLLVPTSAYWAPAVATLPNTDRAYLQHKQRLKAVAGLAHVFDVLVFGPLEQITLIYSS